MLSNLKKAIYEGQEINQLCVARNYVKSSVEKMFSYSVVKSTNIVKKVEFCLFLPPANEVWGKVIFS